MVMSRRLRSMVGALVCGAIAVTLSTLGADPAAADPNPIEEKYRPYLPDDPSYPAPFKDVVVYDNGGHAGVGDCDIEEEPLGEYTVVYPGPPVLGAFGDHPVVVWANGTTANIGFTDLGIDDPTCYYAAGLRHLAAWGFVVIAPNDGTTGTGVEVRAAIDELTARNDDPQDIFYQALDLSNITAAGHSQGADGAINAAVVDDRITSVMALSKADPAYCHPNWKTAVQTLGPDWDYDCATVATASQLDVPVFFVAGANECADTETMRTWFSVYLAGIGRPFLAAWVANPANTPCISTEASNKIYYDAIPGPAARAVVLPNAAGGGAGHVDVSEAIGYMTAWMAYMSGSPALSDAAGAFTGPSPEIATNTGWTNWNAKNLCVPAPGCF